MNGRFLHLPAVAAIYVFGSLGCDNPLAPGDLVPGLIVGFEGNEPLVSLGIRGTTLTVELRSYGNACRERGELRPDVSEPSRTVTISVYDRITSLGPCDDILRTFAHATAVDIGQESAWTVVVTGHDASRYPVRFEYSIDRLDDHIAVP